MTYDRYCLREVAQIITGKTPPTTQPENFGGEIPFVTPAELDSDSEIKETPRTLSVLGASFVKSVPQASTLVCCIGSLGKVGYAGRELATNQQINSVIFDPYKVDPRYGFWAIKQLKRELLRVAPATTVPIVSKSLFEQLKIPLPPLPQQKRIAAILDQAADLIRLRKEALAKLDVLSRAIFHDMFGDLRQNKNGFDQLKLTDALIFKTGKLDSNASKPDGKYPFFTCAKEVSAIDTYAFDTEALLLAGNNASGDYDVKHYKGKFNAYQRTYVIKINHEGLEYQFVQRCLELMLKDLKRYSKGSNTKYLTMEILGRMKLSIPSKELQRDYLKKMRFVTAQQQTGQRALVTSENLNLALQQQAFRGLI